VQPDGDEGVDQHGQHAGADERGGGGREHHPVLLPDVGQGDEQRQRGRGDERHLHPLPGGQHTPVHEQGRQAADDKQHGQEQHQPARILGDRLQVDRHSRRHEEDRDEYAIADRVELALQADGVHVEPVRPDAQHDPG
jgi:hypothetical protein